MEELYKKQDEIAMEIAWAEIHDLDRGEIGKLWDELNKIDYEIFLMENK
jgi:hypothetical protein